MSAMGNTPMEVGTCTEPISDLDRAVLAVIKQSRIAIDEGQTNAARNALYYNERVYKTPTYCDIARQEARELGKLMLAYDRRRFFRLWQNPLHLSRQRQYETDYRSDVSNEGHYRRYKTIDLETLLILTHDPVFVRDPANSDVALELQSGWRVSTRTFGSDLKANASAFNPGNPGSAPHRRVTGVVTDMVVRELGSGTERIVQSSVYDFSNGKDIHLPRRTLQPDDEYFMLQVGVLRAARAEIGLKLPKSIPVFELDQASK